MMHMEEVSFEKENDVWFKRVWTCCGETWEIEFCWNDLNSYAYVPVCKRCLNGPLFFS